MSPPLVIDLGCHSLRMGFAGSAEPQMIYPNASSSVSESHLDLLGNLSSLEADSVETIRRFDRIRSHHLTQTMGVSEESVSAMIRRRKQRDKDRNAKLWLRSFSDFPVDPLKKYDDTDIVPIVTQNCREGKLAYSVDIDRLTAVGEALWGTDAPSIPSVVLTEPIPGQTALKNDLVEIAFESWMVPSCLSAPSQIFQATAAATPTTLLVDVGHTHMTTCYIADGYIHQDTVHSSSLSVDRLDKAIMDVLNLSNPNQLKPFGSFFDSTGSKLSARIIEEQKNKSFASHPLPFTTANAIWWQKLLLMQVIREMFSSDDMAQAEMNEYLLPDGTAVVTDAEVYSNLSSYLCGSKALPKSMSSEIDSPKGSTHCTLIDLLSKTSDAIAKLHRSRTAVKKKSKASEKSTCHPALALPERISLTGGGSLSHKFDEEFKNLFHSTETANSSLRFIGLHGPKVVDFSYNTQTAKTMWENVQKNPTCTNAILRALKIPMPGEEPLPEDPLVQIISGHESKDRLHMAYRGASIIASVGSFETVTVSMEEYLESGIERALSKLPI
eukprot:GHVH01011070.1.p1 GENE.GHVH01011070.1~~GHVH01011070.1.p1  ORF type:complete len:561 (-),score=67.19 GHVH01011070.1:76-1737(-)